MSRTSEAEEAALSRETQAKEQLSLALEKAQEEARMQQEALANQVKRALKKQFEGSSDPLSNPTPLAYVKSRPNVNQCMLVVVILMFFMHNYFVFLILHIEESKLEQFLIYCF